MSDISFKSYFKRVPSQSRTPNGHNGREGACVQAGKPSCGHGLATRSSPIGSRRATQYSGIDTRIMHLKPRARGKPRALFGRCRLMRGRTDIF